MKVILASASERRKELLARIVDDFEVRVSSFDEEKISFNGDVDLYVKTLSKGKAKDIESKVSEDCVIIAADTIVVINDKILGKPRDEEEAMEMLKLLSDNVHRVYSGVTVINTSTGIMESKSLYTEVYFSKLTDEEIHRYIETGECLDKAGAYGIQGFGGVFVEKINGCYYNVVGLPLNLLNKILKDIT
ncbi:Maf-like protein [Clostridium celatum]|uniref:Maf-like protein n=1 Tax=Clostridium celatum TaxID=36834 RepID=UPI00319E01A0